MVYANTEESFLESHSKLLKDSPESFVEYFLRNWDNCRQLWATFITNYTLNFRTRTNNRIERHNHELKKVLHSQNTLADCIRGILKKAGEYKARNVHDTVVRSMCKSYNIEDNHDIIHQIREMATNYAANLAIAQYRTALELEKVASVEELSDSSYKVSSNADAEVRSVVLRDDAECSCSFWSSFALPCRHIFLVLLSTKKEFSQSWITKRWSREYQMQLPALEEIPRAEVIRPSNIFKAFQS